MRKFRTNKDKKLQQDFIRWRKKFVQIVLPIVRELMAQYEASVVIDTINRGLIYDQNIDVTDIIIKRLDEEFLSNPRLLEKIILVE
jgi:Skp family chaperone for outer membrane proteins